MRCATACGLGQSDPYTLFAVALVSFSTGELARATAAAQRAIDLSPSFALGHLALAWSRLFAGRASAAIDPLLRAFRLDPTDNQAFLWLGYLALAYYLAGDLDEAVERAGDAVGMRPESYTGQCALACSLAMLGREAEARHALDNLQRVYPEAALRRLIGRFRDPGDEAKIVEGLRRAGWTGAVDVEPPTSS